MIDFRKLSGKQAPADLTDPLKLFESLDRKGSHTHLRPAQIKALELLHARRIEQDTVLKMPTGTGKSVVGLLYLKALMGEKKRPGVYLRPTTQLVQQVVEEAERLCIPAHAYLNLQ